MHMPEGPQPQAPVECTPGPAKFHAKSTPSKRYTRRKDVVNARTKAVDGSGVCALACGKFVLLRACVCVHVCLFAPCFLCIHASLSVLFLLHGYRQRKLVETLRRSQPQRRSRRLSP